MSVAGLGEFELIARYFTRAVPERQGVGDDCALIDVGATTLALTADALVEGLHFFPGAEPRALGHKALAVNLSDLAAAGAKPRCCLLTLALPAAEADWLQAFAAGLLALADAHGCALIGGDTVGVPPDTAGAPGPRMIGITAVGEVPRAQLRGRGGARPGDELWVSGTLGDAALAVAARRGDPQAAALVDPACHERLDRPQPRVALGIALRGVATAAIDLSDGLAGDLAHVLRRSGVGAQVEVDRVPCRPPLAALPPARRHALTLAGGDDYELLFTAASADRERVARIAAEQGLALSCIGRIVADPAAGLELRDARGARLAPPAAFAHFAACS